MLEDCLFASRSSTRSKKPATLALSVIVHVTLAGALILIPLFQNQLLPQIPLLEPLQPPVAARGVELVPVARAQSGRPSTMAAPQLSALRAPDFIPSKIAIVDEPATGPVGFLPSRGNGNGSPHGIPGGDPFGDPNGIAAAPPPPAPAPPPVAAPPAAPEPTPTAPIRRGGDVVQSNLIHTVQPVYPRLAVIARVQGAVILEAVITREGTIDPSRLRVLQTDHSLLTPAAIEAVQQLRYRPTLLNGQPVEILTNITVNFKMN